MKKEQETGYNLKLPKGLRIALKKRAAENDVSMGQLIISILIKAVLSK